MPFLQYAIKNVLKWSSNGPTTSVKCNTALQEYVFLFKLKRLNDVALVTKQSAVPASQPSLINKKCFVE